MVIKPGNPKAFDVLKENNVKVLTAEDVLAMSSWGRCRTILNEGTVHCIFPLSRKGIERKRFTIGSTDTVRSTDNVILIHDLYIRPRKYLYIKYLIIPLLSLILAIKSS